MDDDRASAEAREGEDHGHVRVRRALARGVLYNSRALYVCAAGLTASLLSYLDADRGGGRLSEVDILRSALLSLRAIAGLSRHVAFYGLLRRSRSLASPNGGLFRPFDTWRPRGPIPSARASPRRRAHAASRRTRWRAPTSAPSSSFARQRAGCREPRRRARQRVFFRASGGDGRGLGLISRPFGGRGGARAPPTTGWTASTSTSPTPRTAGRGTSSTQYPLRASTGLCAPSRIPCGARATFRARGAGSRGRSIHPRGLRPSGARYNITLTAPPGHERRAHGGNARLVKNYGNEPQQELGSDSLTHHDTGTTSHPGTGGPSRWPLCSTPLSRLAVRSVPQLLRRGLSAGQGFSPRESRKATGRIAFSQSPEVRA